MPVYFIRNEENGLIKIGFSTRLRERFAQLKVLHKTPMTILGIVNNSNSSEEFKIHAQLSNSRATGEWFHPTEEVMNFVESLEPYKPEVRNRSRISRDRVCKGTRDDGQPCGACAQKDNDFCYYHQSQCREEDMQIRQSLKLSPTEWAELERLAAETNSLAERGSRKGEPAWRNLIKRIARGDLVIATKEEPTRA